MKRGLLFYLVAILTLLSAGFCAFTIKESVVGASYHENSAYYEVETPEPAPVITPEPSASPTPPVTVTPKPSASTKPKPKPVATNPKYPDRLIIPSISVNAFVQQTGLTKNGAMGTPTNFSDVAWYKLGAIPGEKGNAVIDGHVDNALAMPGVFKNLPKVTSGDDVYVVNKKGEKKHFVVKTVTTYNVESVPVAEIFGKGEESRLYLITCGGAWISENKTYENRTIVMAELAS